MKKFIPGLMLDFPNIQCLCAHNTPFIWTPDLRVELDKMKEVIKQNLKLSPLDTSKEIYAYTDVTVTMGMAYLLFQRQDENDKEKGYHIISCDSTTFWRGQCGSSPFEAKLAAIVFMAVKEDLNIEVPEVPP